jgi:hypothetical protein
MRSPFNSATSAGLMMTSPHQLICLRTIRANRYSGRVVEYVATQTIGPITLGSPPRFFCRAARGSRNGALIHAQCGSFPPPSVGADFQSRELFERAARSLFFLGFFVDLNARSILWHGAPRALGGSGLRIGPLRSRAQMVWMCRFDFSSPRSNGFLDTP